MPGQRRSRWTTSTEATNTARLPVAWTPDDTLPPRRPRIGMSQEELDERERRRRNRVRIGAASAVLGLLTMVTGFFLRSGDGNDVNLELQRALNLQNNGRLEEAAAIYQEVIAEAPDSTIAYFNLAVIDQTQGRDAEAAANSEQVLALDPAYTPALFNLAILRADEGDTAAAIGLYRRVIAINPDHAPALMNLGLILLQEGEEVEASEMINHAIEMDPSMANGAETP